MILSHVTIGHSWSQLNYGVLNYGQAVTYGQSGHSGHNGHDGHSQLQLAKSVTMVTFSHLMVRFRHRGHNDLDHGHTRHSLSLWSHSVTMITSHSVTSVTISHNQSQSVTISHNQS